MMDWRSHRLFGGILLNKAGKDRIYDSWTLAPDLDKGPLHRWHRHRFSVLNEIYNDGMEICRPLSADGSQMDLVFDGKSSLNNIDKDAIVLCVTSHFYLDMFNGFIAPFGILCPIYLGKLSIGTFLKNENDAKLLIKELNAIPITEEFSIKFYGASRTIMNEFVSDMRKLNLEEIVSIFIYRMGTFAQMDKRDDLYRKAILNICNFTGNEKYAGHNVRSWKDGFENFEHKYIKLINTFTEFL
jgi:hypothetical protein